MAGRYDGKTSWGSWYAKLVVQQGRSDKDKYMTESNGAGAINKHVQEDERIREDQIYAGAGIALYLGKHLLKAGVELDYDKRRVVAEANNMTTPLSLKTPGANDLCTIEEVTSILYLQDE
ncbi:hypothetical protein [Chitinivorax sp. B]|uniref:hypothetical protein n=1 Tax=Chitinivorax sp. B TaxID=2502235 RepID=UPI0010F63A73|nr:hypothetical protein [Chitinivorax sp. B]